MILLGYIIFSILFVIFIIIYGAKNYYGIYQDQVYTHRFVSLPTMLDIYPEKDSDEDEEFSEDLRKLIGQEPSNSVNVKRVTTSTVIDLEEILTMAQWTTSRYEDEKIVSDSTMITFRTGDHLLVMEKLESMEKVLDSYLSLKVMRR